MRALILLLFLIKIDCIAQKPMNKKLIDSKLDSILVESNLLYKYLSSEIEADALIDKEKIQTVNRLSYLSGDTLRVIYINKEIKCIYEVVFVGHFSKPISLDTRERSLNLYEDSLFKIKDILTSNLINDSLPVGYNSKNIIIPEDNGFRLYKITTTQFPNIIPFGNDFLYRFDIKGRLKDKAIFYNFKPKSYDSKTFKLILVYNKNIPFLFSTDIVKFRLYCKDIDIKEFTAYSPRNRIYFTFNKLTNKIITHY
ncbi:hypothetical protein [Acidiluteibacter ferrifornacis]|uniref:Uncharacterized protein n=1 Tax=Acidiluteibacter ferrifornacis TaxID=2692424 RepID=A0A6N9NFN7_9FLAO|nr:hypothetical protein [Acidiluteibacter ferrifornacis]NBG65456.1 hypothetical protein [Acidiluteibacter ferrifornacis]